MVQSNRVNRGRIPRCGGYSERSATWEGGTDPLRKIRHHLNSRCMTKPIHIIGGGLAGSEAAWACARAGVPVILHEMRGVHGP